MHPNEKLIQDFYSAFQRHDAAGMAACYHPDITFTDSVFQGLKGDRAKAMWYMLTERGKDMQLTVSNIKADDQIGSAHWEAHYTYSATGRKVINKIDSAFKFKDGKIIEQRDTFNLTTWARQALGPSGVLLGWTPFMQNAIRRKALEGLDKFIAKK